MTERQKTPDATIIGAGIVGLCCALSLLDKGKQVRIIAPSAEDRMASIGNAGVISPWSCIPQSMPGIWKYIPGWVLNPEGPVSLSHSGLLKLIPWTYKFLAEGSAAKVRKVSAAMTALNSTNIDLYRHHLRHTGSEHLIKDSWYVQVYENAGQIQPGNLNFELLNKRKAPYEFVEAAQLQEIEPALSKKYQAGVVIKNQARAISPANLCEVFSEKALRQGAELLPQTVLNLVPDENGEWIIQTDTEALKSKNVVLAAGIWSKQLLSTLGVSVPLIPERGYHMEFSNPGVELNHSVMDVSRKFVASSMMNGIRAAGTAEFAQIDDQPNYKRAEIFAKLAKKLLPDLDIQQPSRWMGIRPSFPDSLPCIGKVPNLPNLFTAFGHSHYGMGMAPKTGEIIAALVSQERPDINIEPYSINRFD